MRQYCDRYAQVNGKLEKLRKRLSLYLEREAEMLSKNGVKSYTIGPRSRSGHDTALKDVQDAIEKLQNEIAEMEARLCGSKPRKAVQVVPRDDW